jgi:histidinol-phosphate/aromatic aminotransferase/cobyric acid decarboxylase-like protein
MNLFFLEGKDDFRTNVDELIKSVKKSGSDFLIINNPNNPVGNTLERGDIKKLLETEVFVVVDEAFIDFCREKSVEDLIEKYDNLIVINSCSKSMGFPGLRLGYLLTKNKKIKEKIKKILPIWNINSLTEVFIEIFPEFKSDYEVSIKKILAERKHLFKKLKELKFFKPFESQANFIFCETRVDNKKLAEFLYTKHNILIKTGLNQDFLPGDKYIRIGIRTREDNKKIINALKTFSFKH